MFGAEGMVWEAACPTARTVALDRPPPRSIMGQPVLTSGHYPDLGRLTGWS